jgi:dipeptidyl aminopeptidase/acylaminoacyl peptidase
MGTCRAALVVCLIALAFEPAAAGDEAVGGGGKAPAPESRHIFSTRDFFRHPLIGEASISPDGRYLALLLPKGDKTQLNIVETATLKSTAAYDMGADEFVVNLHWTGDDTVVWEAAERFGALDKPYRTGNLMSGRADKPDGHRLGSELEYLGRINDNPHEVLAAWDKSIYRVNVHSTKIIEVAVVPFDDAEVYVDNSGKVRLATTLKKEDLITDLWDDASRHWGEWRRFNRWGGKVKPLSFAADNRHVYVGSDVEAPTNGVYLADTESDERKLLFRDDKVDWHELLFVPGTEEPAGVLSYPDYPAYHFFDEQSETAKLYADLRGAFPNCLVQITSSSADGRLAVVKVESDRQPEVLYLLDREKHGMRLLFKSMPWIDPQEMSEMSAFVITTRDKVELHGYLTLPKGAGEKNLPMIVLPHGGPHGVRDLWGYDPEVQFLANHGYAVLQINFRGSGGYGRDLESLGYGHWGTTMQDDVTDATLWAIQEGIADPSRICIYGASYGGYSALMGAIREPDLYRCAASYVGVTDLLVERRYSDTSESTEGRLYMDRAYGTNKDDLKARSPVYNVDAIKVPLFLAQGGSDRRVPKENFTALTSALSHAGKTYESLFKEEEGHGFYKEDNQVELYDHLLAFFNRNTGPKTQ